MAALPLLWTIYSDPSIIMLVYVYCLYPDLFSYHHQYLYHRQSFIISSYAILYIFILINISSSILHIFVYIHILIKPKYCLHGWNTGILRLKYPLLARLLLWHSLSDLKVRLGISFFYFKL